MNRTLLHLTDQKVEDKRFTEPANWNPPLARQQPLVIFEDNHMLVVNKPPGMLVQGDSSGDESVVDWAKEYRKTNENKPGNVFVGLVHRLDRPVGGIVLLAKTSKSASRLSEQFRKGTVQKHYLAICHRVENRALREIYESRGPLVWVDQLVKDRTSNQVSISNDEDDNSQTAETEVSLISETRNQMALNLQPLTGRSHQLRVACASRGFPILGDRKYGSPLVIPEGLLLHAHSIDIEHPTNKERFTFQADPPKHWERFARELNLFE